MSHEKPLIREVPGLHDQHKPVIPAGMKKLGWLIGSWTIEADYYNEGKVIARRPQEHTFAWLYGGMYLQADYRAHGPLAYWEARQTILWDAEKSLHGGMIVDRFGSVAQTEGHVAGPQEFYYTLSRPLVFMDGGVKQVRVTLSLSAEEVYGFDLSVDRGGGFQTLIGGQGGRIA
jgi:hypothetical protein